MSQQRPLHRPAGRYWPLRLAYSQAWLDIGSTESDTVLVAGVGRSGTTWLSEVITQSTKSRELFEPFLLDEHHQFVLLPAIGSSTNHLPNQSLYIPINDGSASHYYQPVKTILEGRIRSWWTEQGMSPGIYKRRLIKDIRANLMLGWLNNCWPRLKIIYIVRQPLQTVASMLERSALGWGFDWDSNAILKQEQLVEDYLRPFISILEAKHEHASRLMLRWCVENYVALQALNGKQNVMLVKYDELLKNQSQWNEIFQFVNWQCDQKRFTSQVNRLSKTSAPNKNKQIVLDVSKHNKALIKLVHQFDLQAYL
jgi:hypothetical protein